MMKRLLLGGGVASALVVAFLLGSITLGVAGAQIPPGPTPPATVQDGPTQEDQQPSYTGSITVPQDKEGQGEQAEGKALEGLAKITADQAKEAALAQYPGATVGKVELDNENGYLVYSVRLTDSSGKGQDVKVDAGNSKVLATEADGPDDAEAHGSTEKDGAED